MNFKRIISSIILLNLISAVLSGYAAAEENTPVSMETESEELPEFTAGVELYNEGEYKKAGKKFKNIIKEHPETEWAYRSRIYQVRILHSNDNISKAIQEIGAIIDEMGNSRFFSPSEVIAELKEFSSPDAMEKLKELLRHSKITELRQNAAQAIGRAAKSIDPDSITRHIDFMVEALETEPKMEVAKEISKAIYNMGSIKSAKLISMYKRADVFLKKKLLYLISMYDDEDLIMALQEESDSTSSIVKNYVSWALANMDPYRFARLYRGKLKKEEDAYILRGQGFRYELLRPSLKREETPELEALVGRNITLYGVETDEGIIYTNFFESK
ncbi:MAG: hypothetical protein ABIH89_09670 [Elusimicrobiota bacterium]